jgi:hypothetical protein
MTSKSETLAAWEDLPHVRLPKMVAARAALKQRARKSGTGQASAPAPVPGCEVKLDRQQLYCVQNPTAALMAVSGFKSLTRHRINRPADGRFQAYGRVHWFESRASGMKRLLESERREAWLLPYRVTLYADDATGLLPDEVFGVLELLPDFRMTMMELAFDSAPKHIDRKFVRNHALFGKSQPMPSIGTSDYWGSRRGAKRAQGYLKKI